MSEVDNQSPTLANQPTAELKPPQPEKKPGPSRLGPFFRRALFVILLLVVLIGIGVAGFVLNRRLAAAVERNAALQTEIDSMRGDIAAMSQELDDQATQHDAALKALEDQTAYVTLLLRAQTLTTKAQLDLIQENVGEARDSIGPLMDTLTAAADFAPDDDLSTLADLQSRVDRAGRELGSDTYASQQDLQTIWHKLDELAAAQVAPQK